MKPDVLGTLIRHFVLLSLVAIGGANAVVPEMHRVAVELEHWMTDRQFAELFALANAAPGPNVLMVSLIGFQAAGFMGAVAATVAMCAPSCVLTYFAVRRWERSRNERVKRIVQRGLAPVTIGLVAASAYLLTRAAIHDWLGAVLTAGTFALMAMTKYNPLWIFGLATALGLVGIS
ncbi:chromate transporter [Aliidongia dinghuensis]|uniref:Chromate transporter n=1 Tax=Aliidongia dinghuensis TaxID=1867774 RepID=A0A8J2YZA6_9PROT|nr:chromate transporter [Aliidongia dinghuensis]GGF35314.1 chromate transporter [Aliidongia dinghuensis]